MSLDPGTVLGPYRIEEPIGAGGMGEVYRAIDTRLDRTVAIKILPSHLSANPELRQRFDREAKTISSLQHANICSLFDVGHENDIDFLVMEHIEGDNLSKRLADGPLPPDQVLQYGQQITEALEAAHKAGVVHRDLKPGNVMITRAGVKLLDFGLAKTAEAGTPTESSLTNLPTVQPGSEPLTTQGTILGTYQYMSPEQLEGKEADARSDIFSLGAVLYEMATGRKAFAGDSQASLIASIMSSDPAPISSIHALIPPAMDRVVTTCLEKDPEDRWQTAHDVALQLKWIAEGGSQVGLPKSVSVRRHRRERLAWILAGAATAAALFLAYLHFSAPKPGAPVATRFNIQAPSGVTSMGSPRISPDGRHIAFNGIDTTGTTRLWVRSLATLDARPIPGTENCTRAFWSPDSKNLGFIANSKVKRVALGGGPPLTLCDFPTGADGAWGSAGVLLMDGTTGDSINAIPAGGGPRTGATTIDRAAGESTHGWPYFLPDGERFLFVAWRDDNEHQIRLGKLGSFETEFITLGDSRLEYMEPGYLVFERGGTLLAQPFDAEAGELSGDPFPLMDDIGRGGFGLAHFSGSTNETMIYTVANSTERELVWFDRKGSRLESLGEPGQYQNPALSADGKKVAFHLPSSSGAGRDVWTMDLVRGTRSRLTFNESFNSIPLWSPDGSRIVFGSDRDGDWDVFIRNGDGTGTLEKLLDTDGLTVPYSWSTDGATILGHQRLAGGDTGFDVFAYRLTEAGGTEVETLIQTDLFDGEAAISPDGRYFAYSSYDGTNDHVYLSTFPVGGGRWQVSTDLGGEMPQWRADGKELYFLADDSDLLLAVDVDLENGVSLGVPSRLFSTRAPLGITTRNLFVPAADGEKFLVVSLTSLAQVPPLTVILNWTAEVKER